MIKDVTFEEVRNNMIDLLPKSLQREARNENSAIYSFINMQAVENAKLYNRINVLAKMVLGLEDER